MNTQILFSVIIPTFNRRPFLEAAVRSVLDQTYRGLELIVVDDGSHDGTREMISSFKDNRLRYVYQSNRGVSRARNRGLELASGHFIAFLDSDDRWVPEKLEKTLDHIKASPDTRIFHTDEAWYRGGSLLNQKKKHQKPSGVVYRNALPLCCISISTAAIGKNVFESIGAFDESMKACEDYDFWLRATNRYRIKLIPEELTIKDGGRPDQLSSSVWGLDRFRIRALEKMLTSDLLEAGDHKATLKELVKKCEIFAAGCEKRGKSRQAERYRNLPLKYRIIV